MSDEPLVCRRLTESNRAFFLQRSTLRQQRPHVHRLAHLAWCWPIRANWWVNIGGSSGHLKTSTSGSTSACTGLVQKILLVPLPTFLEVWSRALGLIGDRVTVAHYAGFDCSVARHSAAHWVVHVCCQMPFACTYRLAKLDGDGIQTAGRIGSVNWPLTWDRASHHDPLSDTEGSGSSAQCTCVLSYQASQSLTSRDALG